jgi:hypothetical protein
MLIIKITGYWWVLILNHYLFPIPNLRLWALRKCKKLPLKKSIKENKEAERLGSALS